MESPDPKISSTQHSVNSDNVKSDNVKSDNRFWNELYWFFAIGLVGLTISLIYLPGEAEETLRLLGKEKELSAQIKETQLETHRYKEGVEAVESDPYYRAMIYRDRLRILRENEKRLVREEKPTDQLEVK